METRFSNVLRCYEDKVHSFIDFYSLELYTWRQGIDVILALFPLLFFQFVCGFTVSCIKYRSDLAADAISHAENSLALKFARFVSVFRDRIWVRLVFLRVSRVKSSVCSLVTGWMYLSLSIWLIASSGGLLNSFVKST